ncbi:hypothetical protein ACTXT7_001648 [Hymenolepis weldensis]
MVVAEEPLTRRYFITNAVHTVPSISYKRPVQLKHAHNHVLTRVLIQAMNINSLSNTYTTHTAESTYHGIEIPYIFGYSFLDDDYWPSLFDLASIPMRAQVNGYRNPKDIEVSRLLISLWSNFIKTG